MEHSCLGPFCIAAGITVDMLSSNGPFPALNRICITNGLVFQLQRYIKIRRIKNSSVASWLILMGLDCPENTLTTAIIRICEKRNELRRKKRSADIPILENEPFHPVDSKLTTTLSNPTQTVETQTVIATPSHHAPLDSAVKEANVITHEISKRNRELVTLKTSVKEANEELIKVKSQTGHFKPANVTKRDKRAEEVRKERDTLKAVCQELQRSQEEVKENLAVVEAENMRLEKSRKYFKKRSLENECTQCEKLKHELREQSVLISKLTVEVEELRKERHSDRVVTKDRVKFNTDIRACVMELIGLEVSTAKVAQVIQAISKNMFHHQFKDDELPSRTTCQSIADEGQIIARQYMSKRLHESGGFGVHKDGTTRKRRKIIDATIVTDRGESFSMGFNLVASETGQAIADNVTDSLADLCTSPSTLKSTAKKMVYCMSDRASNEKKSNKLLHDWQRETVDADANFQDFFCMAHVLLGFQNECIKELKPVQMKLSSSGKMGRDRHEGFKAYKCSEPASRLCASVSSAFAPVGEHFGVREKWEAYCSLKDITSTVKNFKDNRFNGLFQVAASCCLHRKQFLEILGQLEAPNKKLAALQKDLEDDNLMTIMKGLGIMFIQVTEPYWSMINTVTYLQMCPTIKELLRELEATTTKPEELLHPGAFSSLKKFKNPSSPFYSIIPHQLTPSLTLVLSTLSAAFVSTIKRQLKDVLEQQHSREVTEATKFAPSTNLVCERNFGDLDSSQHRRPSASLFHHNTVHALKRHRQSIVHWLDSMSQEQKAGMWKSAGAKAPVSRKLHQVNCKRELLKTLHPKKTVTARKLVKKAKSVKRKSCALEERVKVISKSKITVNQWIIAAYLDNWYPGIVTRINDETETSFEIDFCQRIGRGNNFRWPEGKDKQTVERKFLLSTEVDIFTTTGRTWAIRRAKDYDQLFRSFATRFFLYEDSFLHIIVMYDYLSWLPCIVSKYLGRRNDI